MTFLLKNMSILLLVSFLGGCFAQKIVENPMEWKVYQTAVDRERVITYKAPSGEKYGHPPKASIDLSSLKKGKADSIAFFAYDPGRNSSKISQFTANIVFVGHTKNEGITSIGDLEDYIRKSAKKSEDYRRKLQKKNGTITINPLRIIKKIEVVRLKNRDWLHVIKVEKNHPERVTSDVYYTPFNNTHILYVAGVYKENLRKKPALLSKRRGIVKTMVSEIVVN